MLKRIYGFLKRRYGFFLGVFQGYCIITYIDAGLWNKALGVALMTLGMMIIQLTIFLRNEEKNKYIKFLRDLEKIELESSPPLQLENTDTYKHNYDPQGTCGVCGKTGVKVNKVYPTGLVAQHYGFKCETWVCMKCWNHKKSNQLKGLNFERIHFMGKWWQ